MNRPSKPPRAVTQHNGTYERHVSTLQPRSCRRTSPPYPSNYFSPSAGRVSRERETGPRQRRRCNVSVMEEPLDVWFKREILSQEESLTRFLSRVWSRRDEVPDIRQESYARVYEAAQKSRPQAPKAFLFATAKHLMADRVRR